MHYIPSENYAVILNKNAGRVNNSLIEKLAPFVPKGSLKLSESQLHARDIVHELVNDGVETIFAGGGDGTIVDTINNVYDLRNTVATLPAVGALKAVSGMLSRFTLSAAAIRHASATDSSTSDLKGKSESHFLR